MWDYIVFDCLGVYICVPVLVCEILSFLNPFNMFCCLFLLISSTENLGSL